MSNNLLPCPFCGGTNLEIAHAADSNGTYDWKVACADCYILHETEEQAVAAWNRRGEHGTVEEGQSAMLELREKYGHHFDTIDDVDAWVREIRGG